MSAATSVQRCRATPRPRARYENQHAGPARPGVRVRCPAGVASVVTAIVPGVAARVTAVVTGVVARVVRAVVGIVARVVARAVIAAVMAAVAGVAGTVVVAAAARVVARGVVLALVVVLVLRRLVLREGAILAVLRRRFGRITRILVLRHIRHVAAGIVTVERVEFAQLVGVGTHGLGAEKRGPDACCRCIVTAPRGGRRNREEREPP